MGKVLSQSMFAARKHDSFRLIYDHIPKCGGTTLRTGLRRLPGFHDIFHPIDYCGLKDNPTIMATSGHSVWGCHEILPDDLPCVYFTFIRHPLRLAISHYLYWNNIYKTNLSLYEFILQEYRHNLVTSVNVV